jgi:hypothetical protein
VRTDEGEVLAVPPRPPGLARLADAEDPLQAARQFAEQLRVARSLRSDWPPAQPVAAADDAAWARVMEAHDSAHHQANQRSDLDDDPPDPAA